MKKFIAIVLFVFMCVPAFALAQAGGSGGASGGGAGGTGGATTQPQPQPQNPNTIKGVITNPLSIGSDIPSIITAVLENIVMPLASILVVLAILYSGFKFVIAQGAPKEIQEARQGLVWVLVGTLILLGAVGISKALQATVNSIIK